MSIEINEIQDVVAELEQVHTKRIKAETRLEQEMEVLEGQGHASIEEGKKALSKLDTKIEKRETDLTEDFDNFMADYAELFE
ncbi:MAG: hypothetical protein DRQ46_06380 [Gammaproteobacteria bacterium]|nr:MAG: hypothetical protein DRQ46_06380 [Gammaproteobacteria bacterium]